MQGGEWERTQAGCLDECVCPGVVTLCAISLCVGWFKLADVISISTPRPAGGAPSLERMALDA